MATLVKTNGQEVHVGLRTDTGRVAKVEKWNDMQFSTATSVSGGGGSMYQGTGYIDPINVRVTTSVNTSRHTRIYYDNDSGRQEAITAYGFDLEVVEGAEVKVYWYTSAGFPDKLAGFLNKSSGKWYILNDPGTYFGGWLGISWIDMAFVRNVTIVLAAASFVGFRFGDIIGYLVAVPALLMWFAMVGRHLFSYMASPQKYSHKKVMAAAETSLRDELFTLAGNG